MTETIAPPAPPIPDKPPMPPGCRIIVNRAELLAAVELAASVVRTRTPKPVLLCAVLEAADGVLSVRATDLEVAIRSEVPQVQIERAGIVAVNANLLKDLLSKSDCDTVTLDADTETLCIDTGNGNFHLHLSNPADFPPGPDTAEGVSFTLPLASVVATLDRAVLFVQEEGNSRYAFNGILFQVDKKQLTIVATDGRRLFTDSGPLTGKVANASSIIPASTIRKLLSIEGDEVTIVLSDNRATFTVDSITIASVLIEGQFLPIAETVAGATNDVNRKFTVANAELTQAVNQARMFCTEESKGIILSFGLTGLTITAVGASTGKATIRVAGKWEGEELEIGVNAKFLGECLKGAGETIIMQFTAANRPILVRDDAHENAKCIVMPVNIG